MRTSKTPEEIANAKAREVVAGFALYLELFTYGHEVPNTFQAIITPEYLGESYIVSSKMFFRYISAIHPRRKWRSMYLQPNLSVHTGTTPRSFLQISEEQAKEEASERMASAISTLSRLGKASWQLRGEPILVEVTVNDIDTIDSQRAMPYRALARAMKVRRVLGFPDTLLY